MVNQDECPNCYDGGQCDKCASQEVVFRLATSTSSNSTTWPPGLLDRIKAAEQRIQDNHAPRRIPADVTDVDLVLAEVRYLIEGRWPPFWIKDAAPPSPLGDTPSICTLEQNGEPRCEKQCGVCAGDTPEQQEQKR